MGKVFENATYELHFLATSKICVALSQLLLAVSSVSVVCVSCVFAAALELIVRWR